MLKLIREKTKVDPRIAYSNPDLVYHRVIGSWTSKLLFFLFQEMCQLKTANNKARILLTHSNVSVYRQGRC